MLYKIWKYWKRKRSRSSTTIIFLLFFLFCSITFIYIIFFFINIINNIKKKNIYKCEIKCKNNGVCDYKNHCNCQNTNGYRGRFCDIKIPERKICKTSTIYEIKKSIYKGDTPLNYYNLDYVDHFLPFTNTDSYLIEYILKEFKPCSWLEIGSYIGGSVIETAKVVNKMGMETEIISIDTFLGSLFFYNILTHINNNINGYNNPEVFKQYREKYFKGKKSFVNVSSDEEIVLFLGDLINYENGSPTIYKKFKANMVYEGIADMVIPIETTSITGIKTLERMYKNKYLSELFDVIYLDSAHYIDETFIELKACWSLLKPGGILMGDDFDHYGVNKDVTKFSSVIFDVDLERLLKMKNHFIRNNEESSTEIINKNVLTIKAKKSNFNSVLWVIIKSQRT